MLEEKVIWDEGVLLKPQHFQQQDRYWDNQLCQRSMSLANYGWGFTEFYIDEQYLSLGKIVLSRAQGIFPDGTMFEIGYGHEVQALDITPGLTNKRLVLALPLAPAGASETRVENVPGISTRYISHPLEIRNSNAGQIKTSPINCGKLDMQLLFEDDTNLKGYVSMPIVHIVECKPDKSVIIDKDFLPSFMHLNASGMLSGYLREIIGLLSHRGDQLALRVSNAGQTGTAEIADFLLLLCINRLEPIFRHLDAVANMHPEVFYIYLTTLIGELATFAEAAKRPKNIVSYDHNMQADIFSSLMEQARFALSMVLEQHAVELPIQERKYGILASPIHDRTLLANASFILAVWADMEQDVLRASLPKQLKIGSVERIRQLVNLNLPGIKITPLPVAPRQIPFHAGKSYFKLEFTSGELAQLELSGGFAFYISGNFPGLQLQFWAIKE
ncbi:MAG: type VI secretion system baseplate subunit TssK [Desulfarculales bacterium]|jgi:type VI secretion system protein ImpJ|nr:type VI secretion system baseplate subunit TssK [Desulfarculales bacterium]